MKNLFNQRRPLSLGDAQDLAESVPGAHIRCNADTGDFERVVPVNAARRTLWRYGQLQSLRAPANRSKLVGLEFLVLHAIGRNEWNRIITAPVNLDVYADERAHQAEAWRVAMVKMKYFYQQASKLKGIVL